MRVLTRARRARPQPLRHLARFEDQPVFADGRGALPRRGGRRPSWAKHGVESRRPFATFRSPGSRFRPLRDSDALSGEAPRAARAPARQRARHAAASCAAMSRPPLPRTACRRGGHRDRLRRARLYRARGRLCPPGRRPHRGLCLDAIALSRPRRGRRVLGISPAQRAGRADRAAAAASAASSTSRSSRCRPSPPGCSAAGARGLFAPKSMAVDDEAPSGAHRARDRRAIATDQLVAASTSRAISTPAPMPHGGRPSPTACRCMPSAPIVVPHVPRRGAGDLHQSPALGRLPWLRRAAGGDRAGSAL